MVPTFSGFQQGNSFALAGLCHYAFFESPLTKRLGILPSRVPLDDGRHIGLVTQISKIINGIMSGIKTDQQFFSGQDTCLLNHTLQKREKILLTMLRTRSKLCFKAPAFHAEISGNRRVAVTAFICASNMLLFCPGIIHGKHINIKGDMTSSKRSDRYLAIFEQFY